MVFQSYAIWPHMTVFDNVAYPLTLRGLGARPSVRDRVARVLDLVGLAGLETRAATLLSGGQMQRLALCRALVYEPDLLLLDEPFSNLDAKLREQMRLELRLLQRRLGITVLFVTHDQIEALSLSDRIAVMQRGRVEQVGPPRSLYERPASAFVRDFVGSTVILRGRVSALEPGGVRVAMNGALAGRTLAGRSASRHRAGAGNGGARGHPPRGHRGGRRAGGRGNASRRDRRAPLRRGPLRGAREPGRRAAHRAAPAPVARVEGGPGGLARLPPDTVTVWPA